MENVRTDVVVNIKDATDKAPEEAEIECCGLKALLVGLPARGWLGRFVCLRPYDSELNRLNGVLTVLASISLLIATGYALGPNILNVPSNTTPANETLTSAPLQFSGPTNQNSTNLFLLLVSIIGAAFAGYKGCASVICKPNPDPAPDPEPDEPPPI